MQSILFCLILLGSGAFASGFLEAKHDNCTKFNNYFAENSSEFFRCGVQHAEPVRFCRECVDYYINSTNAFNNLLNGVNVVIINTTNTTTTCKSIYFDQARLNLVQQTYDISVLLWNNAACSNCFALDNGTLTNSTSGVASKFFQNLHEHKICIDLSGRNQSSCTSCTEKYASLNDNFNDIKKMFGENLCFDIVDAMNRTRFEWSNVLKCCKDRNTSTTAFIAVSSAIGCLPVLFYLGFFFVTSRRERSEYISAAGDSDNEVNQPLADPAEPLPSTSGHTQIESNAKAVSKLIDTNSDGSDDDDDELYIPPKKLE